jgi:hypothetical protein
MRHQSSGHAPSLVVVCALVCCSACASRPDDTAPRASIGVTPAQPSAEAGAPFELHYRLATVANAAPLPADTWVFVHLLDDRGTLLWTDDHELSPRRPAEGAPVMYGRTMFVPRIPYAGRVRVEAGLYSRETGERMVLRGGAERGGRAYDVASFDLRPASNAVFVSFGDGWHGAERDERDAGREWRWSTRRARLSFRRPTRDAVLWIELDQPVDAVGLQTAELRAGSELIASIPVAPGPRRIERVPLAASRLGTAPTVDLEVSVQPTFVPAATAPLNSQDTRELGVRVFNVHVGFP